MSLAYAEKDLGVFAIVQGVFTLIVGLLFTLMLLFGEPAADGAR
jgi:hypothetical protein